MLPRLSILIATLALSGCLAGPLSEARSPGTKTRDQETSIRAGLTGLTLLLGAQSLEENVAGNLRGMLAAAESEIGRNDERAVRWLTAFSRSAEALVSAGRLAPAAGDGLAAQARLLVFRFQSNSR